jgi:hypothetical protein
VRISSHRELLPEHLVDKVDFDDIDSAARIAAEMIREKRRTSTATMSYLHAHYSVERQRSAYADAILNARQQPELRYQLRPVDGGTRFGLAPWCYRAARGLYHDFRADYIQSDSLDSLVATFPAGFSAKMAESHGMSAAQLMDWYRQGYLVPLY